MLRKLISTRSDFVQAAQRLVLGFVFLGHGAQKMLGWFGGSGFSGTMSYFTQHLAIPAPLGFLAICAEFFGGLGLIFGLLGRVAALGIVVEMIVAVAMIHSQFGFFMNWSGSQKGEGFEYHLLAIVLGLSIVVKGSGAFSLDRLLARPGDDRANRAGGSHVATW